MLKSTLAESRMEDLHKQPFGQDPAGDFVFATGFQLLVVRVVQQGAPIALQRGFVELQPIDTRPTKDIEIEG